MRSTLKTFFAILGVILAAAAIISYLSAPAKRYVVEEKFDIE